MYLFVHSALSPARAASQADLTANHPGLRSAGHRASSRAIRRQSIRRFVPLIDLHFS